jgi:hypothetical protein
MSKVTIELDSSWVKRIHSPLYWVVGTLQGVAVTSAPVFLYLGGKGAFHNRFVEWFVAPLCFAAVYLVGFFYVMLGNAVVAELRKKNSAVS